MQGLDFIFAIIILIMSVVVHEVSHGYAALMMGDKTAYYQKRLTLNPLVHLDLWGSIIVPALFYMLGGFIIGWAKPVPYNPYNLKNQRWGEVWVAAAGPLSNIFLAVVFGLLVRFGMGVFPEPFIVIAQTTVFINLILAFFNLVPIPPLDGSKILFGILPQYMQKFRLALERYGLIFVLLFVFILWQVFFPVIIFLFKLITGM